MGRPSEGLGEAFSCRLPLAMDERLRKLSAETGKPKSVIVRRWLEKYEANEAKAAKWRMTRALKKQAAGLEEQASAVVDVPFHGELALLDANCDCGSCVARRQYAEQLGEL